MTKQEMLAHIDAKAGAVRACYITIAPGQEATYLLKSQQAKAFALAGFAGPVPGLIQAEITATGLTAQAVTTQIMAEESAWAYLAGQIESIRRSSKQAITNAPSIEAAMIPYNQAIATLVTLMR